MPIIGLRGALDTALNSTFATLGRSLGVSFEMRAPGDDAGLDGQVVLGAERSAVAEIDRSAVPTYVVPAAAASAAGSASAMSFMRHAGVEPLLRGRTVTADDVADLAALPSWLADAQPIATREELPVWSIRERNGVRHQYVGAMPPVLEDDEPLFNHLNARRLARLLPLVLFIRSLGDDRAWQLPPLQAALMFDDPNLHWPSYGYVDYAETARQAAAGGYHVSFATIPLDAWFAHAPTSAIFTANAAQLSLLYHGNDHIANELGQSRSRAAMRALLAQARARIARLEARTGLAVARVMAPPHGACSETAIAEMAAAGFEAVCVSRGSLRYHNRTAEWTRRIGMRPCDVVAGLPVIPRFALSPTCQNEVLIAALLNQPIVPMTHHQAVAEGYGLLNDVAAFVNSLGPVAWSDLSTISRSLFATKADGGVLSVRMFSRRVRVPVGANVRCLRIEVSKTEDAPPSRILWRQSSSGRWSVLSDWSEPFAIEPGAAVEIAVDTMAVDADRSVVGPRRFAPMARRILTEGRDRVLPRIRRIGQGRPAAGRA